MITVVSIMHSGTRFIRDKVMAGLVDNSIHLRWPDLMALNTEDFMVVPIRRPENVARAFNNRGWSYGVFCEQWDNLQKLHENTGTLHFVHIEEEDVRDTQLAAISKAIGHQLETDWGKYPEDTSDEHAPDGEVTIFPPSAKHIEFYNKTLEAARGG